MDKQLAVLAVNILDVINEQSADSSADFSSEIVRNEIMVKLKFFQAVVKIGIIVSIVKVVENTKLKPFY